MANHTFCRPKPIKQLYCSGLDAEAIVQDLLNIGAFSLTDDVRANLNNLESGFKVLQAFEQALSIDRARTKPPPRSTTVEAATTGAAQTLPPSERKSERKKDKKHKRDKHRDKSGKEHKKQKDNKDESRKRSADGSDDEGGEKRKKKRQKTAA